MLMLRIRWLRPALVSFIVFALLAQTAVLTILPMGFRSRLHATGDALTLSADATHEYFRPTGDAVSGVPKNNASYHRAPCPALNTLANHGYLPRDGKDITPRLIRDAIIEVFNIDPSMADTLTKSLMANFTLADLGKHNMVEHDASLVHNDAFFGSDPAFINQTLVDDLLDRAKGSPPVITKKIAAQFRKARESDCSENDPEFTFGFSQAATAYGEAALLLLGMGDYDSVSISVDNARSFLQNEKIPDDFRRSPTPITTTIALYVAAEIKALAWFPWTVMAVA